MEQQLAVIGDLGADQQVEVAEAEREEQTRQGRVETDPCLASPARRLLDVVRPADGVVELVLLCPDNDVGALPLAEVDPRLRDGRGALARDRRQVADDEARLALGRDLVDRDHRDADPVGVRHPLVDPARGARILRKVEFANRQHHLAGVVTELVAIGVDVGEVVVLADGLELVQRVAERAVVPQPGVEERRLVLDDRRLAQR